MKYSAYKQQNLSLKDSQFSGTSFFKIPVGGGFGVIFELRILSSPVAIISSTLQ
jgi:hypothetical protein